VREQLWQLHRLRGRGTGAQGGQGRVQGLEEGRGGERSARGARATQRVHLSQGEEPKRSGKPDLRTFTSWVNAQLLRMWEIQALAFARPEPGTAFRGLPVRWYPGSPVPTGTE